MECLDSRRLTGPSLIMDGAGAVIDARFGDGPENGDREAFIAEWQRQAKRIQALGFGFGYGYYSGALAFVQALDEVGGDLSDDHAALRDALSNITLEAPYGPITLDDNRQAIVDTFVAQLVLDDSGEVVQETVAIVPGVDQTFGGTYSSETDPPERDNTPCEEKSLPWQGNEIPVVDGVPQR